MKILTQHKIFLIDRHVVYLTSYNDEGATPTFSMQNETISVRRVINDNPVRLQTWQKSFAVMNVLSSSRRRWKLDFLFSHSNSRCYQRSLTFFGHTIALRPRGMEGGMECTLLEFFRIFRPQKPSEMGFRGVPWPGVEWPNIVSEGLAYFGTSPLKSPMD